jgi:hypothetical protein
MPVAACGVARAVSGRAGPVPSGSTLTFMVIAALVVAIISAAVSGVSVVYARRSVIAADKSAGAAAITAGLDADRRQAELTPRFRVTCEPSNPGSNSMRLAVNLIGPPELERLDGLTVVIRDDHPWRPQGTLLAGGPTPEQVAAQIWGRYRFTPGVGPGADSVRGIPGADATGRSCPTGGLPVGEELPFQLEPTWPPPWSQQPLDAWQHQMRLRLECHKEGRPSWILPCEMRLDEGIGFTEVPEPPGK